MQIKIAAVASWESGNKPNEASGKKSTSNSMDSLDSDEGASTAGSKKSVDTGISEDSNGKHHVLVHVCPKCEVREEGQRMREGLCLCTCKIAGYEIALLCSVVVHECSMSSTV